VWVEDNEEPEEVFREDVEVPDVYWAEDIEKIENHKVREKEIEKAEKYLDEKREREEKYESQGKDFVGFYAENPDLITRAVKAGTRCALESKGVSWDHLGDVSQDTGLLMAGDLNSLEIKDRVKEFIEDTGEENAQGIADRMFEEGSLSEEAYDTISRLVRIHEFESK
jgi:hypothetical protein